MPPLVAIASRNLPCGACFALRFLVEAGLFKISKMLTIIIQVVLVLAIAALAQKMVEKLLERGVYVIGFSYPVVPKGAARIRTQISAAHSRQDLDFAVEKIAEVKEELEI